MPYAVARGALLDLFNQAEFGLGCPINVTDGAAMLLSRFGDTALKAAYLDGLIQTDVQAAALLLDDRPVPLALAAALAARWGAPGTLGAEHDRRRSTFRPARGRATVAVEPHARGDPPCRKRPL